MANSHLCLVFDALKCAVKRVRRKYSNSNRQIGGAFVWKIDDRYMASLCQNSNNHINRYGTFQRKKWLPRSDAFDAIDFILILLLFFSFFFYLNDVS